MAKTTVANSSTLTSAALLDAYTDFMLSRQAMNAARTTLEFYRFTAGKFLEWAENTYAVSDPKQITARLVREYVAELAKKGRSSTTVWNNARAIKTMLHFWNAEGYMQDAVKFDMPRLTKSRQALLTIYNSPGITDHVCQPRLGRVSSSPMTGYPFPIILNVGVLGYGLPLTTCSFSLEADRHGMAWYSMSPG